MTAPPARHPHSPHRLRPPAVTPRLPLFGAALAAAVGGALVAYFLDVEEASLDRPVAAERARPTAMPATQAAPAVRSALPAPAVPPAPTTANAPGPSWLTPAAADAPALTLAELQELQATLAATPDPGGEFARLSEQVLLSDAARRFLQLRAGGPVGDEELNGLVQLIGPLLDAQLRRGDLPLADAVDLKSKLLQAQHPQAPVQQAELARWLAAHPAR